MTIKEALQSMWEEFMTPSAADESPFDAFRQALAHALLGASITVLLGTWFGANLPTVFFVLMILSVFKEAFDYGVGGGLKDSLIDIAFTMSGFWFNDIASWPLIIILTAFLVAVLNRSPKL